MKSQWECLLKNLGVWEGSFSRLSPQGEVIEDIPSIVSLEGLNNNQTVHQVVRRQGQDDLVLEYTSLSKSILFFEDGAFCQGSIQLSQFTEMGAEFGFIYENSRLRLVQLFDINRKLEKLVLIAENLAETAKIERPSLTVDALIGEWHGEVVTMYPDFRSPDTYSTKLQIKIDDSGRLVQSLSFGNQVITSSASINNNILLFDENLEKQVQVLLLPNGASATSPINQQLRQALFLEAGWLINPYLRQRMIRNYNEKGEWVSLSLVTEHKVV
ncbi:MAG: DUF3598 family protein [Scytonematopsis contorta HA4267-MV1]|jgi:hypothetical protein|nr:DUF3598 family protein [Scytonematopsis contorta HA4267-MV1]